MKILVTGGSGFIGSNFLSLMVLRHPHNQFINVDVHSYATNRTSVQALQGLQSYLEVHLDLRNAQALQALLLAERPDRILHLAAETHVDRSLWDSSSFFQANVQGTFSLLEACRSLREAGHAFTLLHVSTDEVYGPLPDHAPPLAEGAAYDPRNPYAGTKAAADQLVRAWAVACDIPTILALSSNNFGPMQHPEKLIPLMILQALHDQPLPVYGDGQQARDWLHVHDHCEALWAMLERGIPGRTYHVGGGVSRKNLDVVQQLCRLVAEVRGIPTSSLYARITHIRDRVAHDRRYALDSRLLQQELGWQAQVDFEQGLRSTVQWFAENEGWWRPLLSGAHADWLRQHYDFAGSLLELPGQPSALPGHPGEPAGHPGELPDEGGER